MHTTPSIGEFELLFLIVVGVGAMLGSVGIIVVTIVIMNGHRTGKDTESTDSTLAQGEAKSASPTPSREERRHSNRGGWVVAIAGVLAIITIVIGQRKSMAWTVQVLAAECVVFLLVLLPMGFRSMELAARSRAQLRKRGYRTCPECEYDLSKQPENGVCPECGTRYSPESLKAAWERIYQDRINPN